MNFVDNLLNTSRLVQRRVRLTTCSGLERHLLDELDDLSLKFSLVTRGKSYVDITTQLDTIWSIIKNRICRQLQIHICDPFESENVKSFVRKLNAADWGSFIPFSHKLPTPSIKVNCHNSKLYHTGLIKNLVEGVINSQCYRYKTMQGDELPYFMKKRGYVPLCPKLSVEIENNNCQVLADASGDMSHRAWHNLTLLEDRIISNASSAIIQELISRGVFENKPSNLNLMLLGTDPSINNINDSNKLLDKLMENDSNNSLDSLVNNTDKINTKDESNLNKVDIKFEYKDFKEVNISDNVLILTNLYYGNKFMKSEYKNFWLQFCDFLSTIKNNHNLKGTNPKKIEVYVVCPKSFKKLSNLNWETLLIFNNLGIIVQLLKLTL